MRQLFLDTETTGISVNDGHRIIEIAAVEMIDRRPTKNHFHVYINPQRDIDFGAQEVHGITSDFLSDKPLFKDIYQDFLAFINGAEIVIHNAPFDIGFLNMELSLVGEKPIQNYCSSVIDTLVMAKKMRPGQRNNLDALCKNFGINNTKRVLHGALLDSELLSEVYIAMTRGQHSLFDAADLPVIKKPLARQITQDKNEEPLVAKGHGMKVQMATDEELEAHNQYIAALSKSGAIPW